MHCLKPKIIVSICGFCVLLLLIDLHLFLFMFVHFLVFIIITISTSLSIYTLTISFLNNESNFMLYTSKQQQQQQLVFLPSLSISPSHHHPNLANLMGVFLKLNHLFVVLQVLQKSPLDLFWLIV